jgi:hypothetical protein
MGQGTIAASGNWLFNNQRPEMDRGLNQRQRHAALAAKVFGRPSYSVRQRDVNRFVGAVDHGFAKLRPHLVWRSEISDILSSKIWCKTGHKHRCAHNLGVASCMMR